MTSSVSVHCVIFVFPVQCVAWVVANEVVGWGGEDFRARVGNGRDAVWDLWGLCVLELATQVENGVYRYPNASWNPCCAQPVQTRGGASARASSAAPRGDRGF